MPSTRNERHGEFIMLLGDRLLNRYTDGGPAVKRSGQPSKNAAKRERRRVRRVKQRAVRASVAQARREG